jgi:hypothetical protein
MRLVSQDEFDKAKSRDKVRLFCDHCNGVFVKPKNDIQKHQKNRPSGLRYCSKTCSYDAHRDPIKTCKYCGMPAKKKFCSQSCSAKFNNPLKPTRKKKCKRCENRTTNDKFCSKKCDRLFHKEAYINAWLDGRRTGMTPAGAVCTYVKQYIFEKFGRVCSRCGWCEINPTSGRVPIQIDHVDGDFRNCSKENLVVLCPNCHSLTPTYMGLNRGRGRDIGGARRKKARIIQPLEYTPGTGEIGVKVSALAPKFLM